MTDWMALALLEMKAPQPNERHPPKWPESTKSPDNVCFVDFGTIGTGSQDNGAALDERTAMALEGELPICYARAFAALQLYRPDGIDKARWQRAINDVALFLDKWGSQAERLGWTAHDIVGSQYTSTALAWALKGSSVIGLARRTAYLSNGHTFVRAPGVLP